MDFGAVLQTAKKLQETSTKKDVRTYCTKFSPPKKEKRKDVTLSDNIKKFLARKEAEEKAKTMVTNKKRDDLLALRAQDKKATRRVSVMLKRTKSANQSVLADAVDVNNTADTMSGCAQPDEDDYGYVSQEAQALYNKLMERYSNMPKDNKSSHKKKASSNMMETKDRVRAALEREKEEAMLPHKRKRKPKDSTGPEEEEKRGDSRTERERETPSAKKSKISAPPPLSFSELLKLAEKKQHEPIVIEVKPKDEEGPLLTKKQKLELQRQQQWKDSRKTRDDPSPSPVPAQLNKIPKLSATPSNSKSVINDSSKGKPKSASEVFKKPSTSQVPKSSKPCDPPKLKTEITKKPMSNGCDNKNVNGQIKKVPDLKFGQPMSKEARMIAMNARSKELAQQASKNQLKPKQFPPTDLKPKQYPPTDLKPRQFPPTDLKPRQFPPTDLKPRQFPPTDLKPKQFPPRDLKPKQFPPSDLRPKQFPPGDVRRKPMGKKRMVIDSDEEYDSDMDDFIDDGPDEMEDYSKHIKEIFGYDKSKYRGADEDVDNMESSFADQMREDKRSARLGLLEDLEDIKREKEEKKRKALKKKGVM